MLSILQQFPQVQFAFAYGSGVFKQPGLYANKVHPSDGPMTDLIFAVDDPIAWHREVRRWRRQKKLAQTTLLAQINHSLSTLLITEYSSSWISLF